MGSGSEEPEHSRQTIRGKGGKELGRRVPVDRAREMEVGLCWPVGQQVAREVSRHQQPGNESPSGKEIAGQERAQARGLEESPC